MSRRGEFSKERGTLPVRGAAAVGNNSLMLRTELAELVVHGFQADGVALGFESEVPDAAFELEDLQFGVGQHGGKEMGGLRGRGFGGRLAHGGILVE